MTLVDGRSVARRALLERYRVDGVETTLIAVGQSMAPTIPPGSTLLVEFGRTPDAIGEVILFRRGAAVIAHRLVARRSTPDGVALITKGDAEPFLDPVIGDGQVLGVVREVRRVDGLAAQALSRGGAAALARISWWSGRAAGVGTRVLHRVPLTPPIERVALRGCLALSRVPTRVAMALIPRLDRGAPAERR